MYDPQAAMDFAHPLGNLCMHVIDKLWSDVIGRVTFLRCENVQRIGVLHDQNY